MPVITAHKWRALSLKRLAHLSELRRTGRWRSHYPSQEAFAEALRDAEADAEHWKTVAYENGAPIEAAE